MEDVYEYYERLFGDADVSRFMLFAPHQDIGESLESLQRKLDKYAEGNFYCWGITEKGEDGLIGLIELLRFDEETGGCSFAYMLGESFWGQGYGTEALTAAFDFAFSRMDVRSITADHMAQNPASGRVMEKAGMKCVAINPTLNFVEAVELSDKQWFVGVQYHPEYSSTVLSPNPLIVDFVKAAIAYGEEK